MDEYMQVNQERWNELVDVHVKSEFYDLQSFKAGTRPLHGPELQELAADVPGKSLLHLQCHFGMDTLSWARLGAQVTGVDFSDKAIAQAQALSKEVGIDAKFVCSNVYDLPQVLSGQFDIVYTSYGVLGWLPDLQRWGQVNALISAGLKIDFLHEFPFCAWACFPDMEKGEDGMFRFKDQRLKNMLPLTFSIKATKR